VERKDQFSSKCVINHRPGHVAAAEKAERLQVFSQYQNSLKIAVLAVRSQRRWDLQYPFSFWMGDSSVISLDKEGRGLLLPLSAHAICSSNRFSNSADNSALSIVR
jgi:hypothetical protein